MKILKRHIAGVMLIALLFFGFPTVQAAARTKQSTNVDGYLYSRFFPAAICADGADETTLEVVTVGKLTKEVSVYWGSHNATWLRMYDDASHGDRISGDGIFSLNHLTYRISSVRAFYQTDMADLGVQVRLIKTTDDTVLTWERLGMVDRSIFYPSIRLGKGDYATRSAFFIADSAQEIFSGYPVTEIECGVSVFPAAYQKLYSYFPDVFDFLVVMPATRLVQPNMYVERVPYCIMVRNEAKNIGVPVFDETAKYHSAGRLRSVIYHSFGMPAILEHELGHTWGMRLGMQAGIVDGVVGVNARYGHWVAETDINGQMNAFINGCTLQDNSDGTWKLKPQDRYHFPYSPLELYVMGLIPASQVPSVHLLKKINTSDPMRVTADSVSTWTIAQLITLEGGERVPSVATSQKNFRAAFIVVSDRSFSFAEMAYFSAMADYFASDAPGTSYTMPFETATGNRATLDATLPGMEVLGLAESAAKASGLANNILSDNYPNPFNPSTTIQFHLQAFAHVTLAIYNLRGESVRTLLDGWFGPGDHSVEWDGLNDAKQTIAGGVYMYVAKAGSVRDARKMLLLR